MGLNEILKIGDKIKKYRKELNLTQADVAVRVGIPRSTYANYENNTREPDLDTFNKIAEALGVTTSQLLGDSTEEIQSNFKAISTSTIIKREIKTIELIEEIVKISDDLGYEYSLKLFNLLNVKEKAALALDLRKFIGKQVKSFLYLNGKYETLPQNMQSHFELLNTETIEAIEKELVSENK